MDEAQTTVRGASSGLVSSTISMSPPNFGALFDQFPRPHFFWQRPGGDPVAAFGSVYTLRGRDSGRFAQIRRQAEDLFERTETAPESRDRPPEVRPRVFGGLSFSPSNDSGPLWKGYPAGMFYLPRYQAIQTNGNAYLTVNETASRHPGALDWARSTLDQLEFTPQPPPSVTGIRQRPERTRWLDLVHRLLDRIDSSSLRKVVLAQSREIRLGSELSSSSLVPLLRRNGTGTHRFLFDPGLDRRSVFLGMSPEQLVSVEDLQLETESLAGTTEAGSNHRERENLASRLATNPKDRNEHDFVVSSLRDRLEPLTDHIQVGPRTIRSLPFVQHLSTPIKATLRSRKHVLSLVERLHPTPAVGGVPTRDALEQIRRVEPFDRGWYSGPVGWFDGSGNGRFAVGIRSALVVGREVHLFAGTGTVRGSFPAEERDEVQLKYDTLLRTIGGD